MQLSDRLEAFSLLGEKIAKLSTGDRLALLEKVKNENPWFIEESVSKSLTGIVHLLNRKGLAHWTANLKEPTKPFTVGLAMAGNIPAVGFHDYLSVLMAGHHAKVKLSSQDQALITYLHEILLSIEPRFTDCASFEEYLKDIDAVIATGSDNTARYFEYYFRKIPHVIRKNRSSCGVIQGDEPREEWLRLGEDVFSYFGLGCRSVSKLFVPQEFDFNELLNSWQTFKSIGNHHKYANNYDYQKSLYLMNQATFLDAGFCLLAENANLVSPISVIFFERYSSLSHLNELLETQREKIQIVVSAQGWLKGSVPFGKSQLPGVEEYADNVNVMEFLTKLR